jgi:hypothetical protein
LRCEGLVSREREFNEGLHVVRGEREIILLVGTCVADIRDWEGVGFFFFFVNIIIW